jgi:hypothetical protein
MHLIKGCKQIGYGWIIVLSYHMCYNFSDTNSDTDMIFNGYPDTD